jgi:hypothetical protein
LACVSLTRVRTVVNRIFTIVQFYLERWKILEENQKGGGRSVRVFESHLAPQEEISGSDPGATPKSYFRRWRLELQAKYANGVRSKYEVLVRGADRQFCDVRRVGVDERIIGAEKELLRSNRIERELVS